MQRTQDEEWEELFGSAGKEQQIIDKLLPLFRKAAGDIFDDKTLSNIIVLFIREAGIEDIREQENFVPPSKEEQEEIDKDMREFIISVFLNYALNVGIAIDD